MILQAKTSVADNRGTNVKGEPHAFVPRVHKMYKIFKKLRMLQAKVAGLNLQDSAMSIGETVGKGR